MNKLFASIMTLIVSTPVWADVLEPPFWRTSSMFTGVIESCLRRIIEPLQFYSFLDIWTCMVMVVLVLFIWKRKSKYCGKFLKWCLICIVSLPILLALLYDIIDLFRSHEKEYPNMCSEDKPLYEAATGNCYPCDTPNNVFAHGTDCEECPNRAATYECGPQCILRDAPGPGYVYKECEGWVKDE